MSDDFIQFDFKSLDKDMADLEKKLDNLDSAILKKVLIGTAAPAVKPMYSEVLKRVPVDTGILKASLKIVKKYLKNKKMVTAGVFPQSITVKAFKDGRIKNPSHYLHFTEYGTKNIPAQAYMRKSFEDTYKQSTAIVSAKLLEVLKALK